MCACGVCVFVFVHACVTKWRTQSSKSEEGSHEPSYRKRNWPIMWLLARYGMQTALCAQLEVFSSVSSRMDGRWRCDGPVSVASQ